MPQLVALTGGTGFIGLHAVRGLVAAGYRPRLLVRRLPVHAAWADLRFEVEVGDLADERALRRLTDGADAVLHLAGAIKARDRAAFMAANADGTEAVARAAVRAGVGRFVLVSSLAAREPHLSDYAASKREAEARLERLLPSPRRVVLRPAAVYGPWDRETFQVFRLAQLGFAPVLGPSNARLGLIEVSDVVAAVLAALDGEGAGGTFALDDGREGGHGWSDLVGAASAAVGRPVRAVRIPPTVLRAVAAINGAAGRLLGATPMLTPGKAREILHPDWTAGREGFERASRWRARVDLASGFAAAAAWYRTAGWL